MAWLRFINAVAVAAVAYIARDSAEVREMGDTSTYSVRLCLVFKFVCVIDVRPEFTARFVHRHFK